MAGGRRRGALDWIEWLGNKLPDPAVLFVVGALLVVAVSQIGSWQGWAVQPVEPRQVIDPVTGEKTLELVEKGDILRPVGLLSAKEIFWCVSSIVNNFVTFPPLGIVLTGVLGVGVAERSGLINAALKAFMLVVPRQALTPVVVFLGVMSSAATDAGYVVLPPLAAALYKSAGRSPIAGVAAAFAGIAGGFNANLLVTSLDPLLAGFTQTGARLIDADYSVNPACNWWFMIASTFVLTLVGWGVTSWIVEKRLNTRPPEEGGPSPSSGTMATDQRLTLGEWRGLGLAIIAGSVTMGIYVALCVIPGAPFHGTGARFARWVEVIVPMIFIGFLVPGVAFGLVNRTVTSGKDVSRMMVETMAGMAPIIVLSFFAAQFIAYFNHSNLGVMMAMAGGKALAAADLPPAALIVAFIIVAMLFDLVMASMSAKYAIMAPIFVPMFMIVGISPELTQASYRIGDSVVNMVTPLNAYMVIILAVVNRYAPRAGMGTVIAMMTPYTAAFLAAWVALLLVWMQLGVKLGPGGGLVYPPVTN